MNYDPNMTLCGRMAKQTVRLTFQKWEYATTRETVVGGNCTGMDVIECAVENIYEELDGEITLSNGKEDLFCEDVEDREDEWLKAMLVKAEIVAIEQESPHA